VSERELQDRLGVGRTPVREALQRLERECLVEVYPRRGIFVSNVNVLDLAVLSEVRGVLEGFAARLAAERSTPADRETSTSGSTGTSIAVRTTRSSRRRSTGTTS
jgi:DNA-binding GntR family transcriptional regulator